MRVAATYYSGNDWKALAFYSRNEDVSRLPPPSIREHTKHVANVRYSFGNVHRALDVYLLNNHLISHEDLNIKKKVRFFESYSKEVDENQRIKYEFSQDIKDSEFERELTEVLRFDIGTFCRTLSAEKTTIKKYSDVIIPISEVKFNNPETYLTSGKHDFVKSCLYRSNLDFSSGTSKCIAGFIPGTTFNYAPSSFQDGKFVNFFDSLLDECLYCYAGYQHDAPFPRTLFRIDQKKLEDELRKGDKSNNPEGCLVRILRVGKRVETGSIYTREQLYNSLETFVRTRTRMVMPTKALEFDPYVAELAKKSESSILYSEGDYQKVQMGLELHGWTQEFRKEQARLYREAGVNTGFFMLIDGLNSPTEGNLELISYAKKYNLAVQLLPVRIPERKTAILMLGKHWNELKGDVNQLDYNGEFGKGGYALTGNNFLSPRFVHQSWWDIIGDNKGIKFSDDPDDYDDSPNIGMCHHMSIGGGQSLEFCSGCLIGRVGIKQVEEEDVTYNKKPKNRRKKKGSKHQHKLEFLD